MFGVLILAATSLKIAGLLTDLEIAGLARVSWKIYFDSLIYFIFHLQSETQTYNLVIPYKLRHDLNPMYITMQFFAWV